MRRPFESDGTRIRVRLDSQERQLLARLLDEVGELLDDGRRPSGDPLADLVGFDLQLPDDVQPFRPDVGGVPSRRSSHPSGGSYPDRLGPGADHSRADGELDGDPGSDPDPDDGPSPRGYLPNDGPSPRGYGPDDDPRDHPDDPALARLLPQAHRDDPELAAEFRRLTETGLRARKRSNLALASDALQRAGNVLLDAQEAAALLKGLTDTRLVLGERLGLRSDEDTERIAGILRRRGGSDDPWVSAALLYDVLTWWQEALVAALAG
jgi:hypothetical protein